MNGTPPVFDTAFASYTRRGDIGQGGAGVVFEVSTPSGDLYALKLLRPQTVTSDKLARFKNEVSFCSTQIHRNIIQVLDSGFAVVEDAKCPFYLMRRFPTTLRRLMSTTPHQELLRLFTQVLDGVEAAHLHRVWHRDLKPENILCDPTQGLAVIADFGIAHFHESLLATAVDTAPNARMANHQYAAPEQRHVGAAVDHRADIYALGLMLNEMFTSIIPIGTGYARIGSVVHDLAYLDDIVESMLRQNPSERPQTIDALKRTLIARHTQFVSRQTLSQLSGSVVLEAAVDDQLVLTPVRLTDADWRAGRLQFTLAPTPNPDWQETFARIDYRECLMGKDPASYAFGSKGMEIPAEEREVARVVEDTKRFVAKANEDYKTRREREAQKRVKQERQKLTLQREEEETRLRVLRSIKL